jgi:hypothetical protein
MTDRAPANLRKFFVYIKEPTDGDYEQHCAVCQYWSGNRGEQFRACGKVRGIELRSPGADEAIAKAQGLAAKHLEQVIRDELERRHARLEVTESGKLRLVDD